MAKTKAKSRPKAAAKEPAAKRVAKPKSIRATTPAAKRVAKPKSTRVTTPAPPAPPPPPAQRDELAAPRDVARLLRYGEKFGAYKIDVKWLTTALPVSSGAIAIGDPAVPKSWRVFDRPVGTGMFRAMTSIATDGRGSIDGAKQRLAAVVVHVGRPPIARWTVAHYRGQKPPRSPDDLPRVPVTSGWIALVDPTAPPSGGAAGAGRARTVDTGAATGVLAVPAVAGLEPTEIPLIDGRRALALAPGNGEYTAYWAVDADDKAIALVIDFDTFSKKDWKTASA